MTDLQVILSMYNFLQFSQIFILKTGTKIVEKLKNRQKKYLVLEFELWVVTQNYLSIVIDDLELHSNWK